jgi:hypothetical protein
LCARFFSALPELLEPFPFSVLFRRSLELAGCTLCAAFREVCFASGRLLFLSGFGAPRTGALTVNTATDRNTTAAL